ncbi:MAG: hypothetical protein LBL90_11275 [Prevotellaceae bacterium]|jgi:hypothetical protein|nr:hypothetical protein [Prevotellaceae bacterium]
MRIVYSLVLAAALLFTACGSGDNKSKKPKAKENGTQYVGDEQGNGIQYAYKNWILVSEIPMKEKDVHGLAKEYYDDGKIHFERNYNMGKLEGMVIEYYSTGEKYMETLYVNNKIDGTQYRYKKDGTIIFEVPYEKGLPIPGIKEHDANGKLVEQPTIVFTRKGGNLEMKMSNNTKAANFYQIVDTDKFKVPSEDGVGKLALGNAPKGSLKIRAAYRTAYGNMGAVEAQY